MQNFIIVGTQRTGSSALGESIGLHHDIACGWEWTEHVPRKAKLSLARQALRGEFTGLLANDREHIEGIYTPDKKWLGYRRLFGSSNKWLIHPRYSLALWKDRFDEHLEWIRDNPDIHIIHIVRRDNVNWLKSKYLARKSKSFVGKPYPAGLKVKVPIREAVARLKSKDYVDGKLLELENTNPYHSVVYEDFLENNSAVVSAILDFLQCSAMDLSSKETVIKKQSKGGADDYIANYDSLMEALKKESLVYSNII